MYEKVKCVEDIWYRYVLFLVIGIHEMCATCTNTMPAVLKGLWENEEVGYRLTAKTAARQTYRNDMTVG